MGCSTDEKTAAAALAAKYNIQLVCVTRGGKGAALWISQVYLSNTHTRIRACSCPHHPQPRLRCRMRASTCIGLRIRKVYRVRAKALRLTLGLGRAGLELGLVKVRNQTRKPHRRVRLETGSGLGQKTHRKRTPRRSYFRSLSLLRGSLSPLTR